MTYKGKITNGTVVLPPDVDLPEGTEVQVTPMLPGSEERMSFAERYKEFIGVCEGPSDLAENHDHYIHGTPKKK